MWEEKAHIMKGNKMFNLSKWKKRRATFNELSRLTDKELNDIGISRCDIPRIVREI